MDTIINSKLSKYTIAELRVLGKWLNLKKPTALSKDDLIVEIEKILKVEQPEVKQEFDDEPEVYHFETLDTRTDAIERIEELEKIAIDEKNNEVKPVEYETLDTAKYSSVSLSSKIEEYVIIRDGKKEKSIKNSGMFEHNIGCVDYLGDFLVIRNFEQPESIIELQKEQIKQYNFKQYDTVDYLSFYSPYQFRSYLVQVNSINGVDVNQHIQNCPRKFSSLKCLPPDESFKFMETGPFLNITSAISPFAKGSRILIKGADKKVRKEIIEELQMSFKNESVATISLFVDLMKEELSSDLFEDSNLVALKVGDSLESKLYGILSAFLRAERFVESGKDVVLIIDDLDEIFNVLEGLITDKNSNYIASLVTKLFDHGGKYDNNGTMTIVAFCGTNNLKLQERISRSATLIVPIDKSLNKGLDCPAVDVKNIENKIQNFYMDEEAITVATELMQMLNEMDAEGYKKAVSELSRLKIEKEELIRALYKI